MGAVSSTNDLGKDDTNLNDPGFSSHTPMMHGRKAREFIGFSGDWHDDLYRDLHWTEKIQRSNHHERFGEDSASPDSRALLRRSTASSPFVMLHR